MLSIARILVFLFFLTFIVLIPYYQYIHLPLSTDKYLYTYKGTLIVYQYSNYHTMCQLIYKLAVDKKKNYFYLEDTVSFL